MKNLKDKIFGNITFLLLIIGFILTIYLDRVILLFRNFFPWASISGIATISDRIIFITFIVLFWYAWETKKIREIEQEPVMLLYIRDIKDYKPEKQQKIRDCGYLIRIRSEEEKKDSDYFIRLRNTGRGTAFNVTVESNFLKVDKYETQFFAPLADEHSIKIIEKGDKKIENWEKLNGSRFVIKCQSVNGKFYSFKFKIINVQKQIVEFIK